MKVLIDVNVFVDILFNLVLKNLPIFKILEC